MATAKQIFHQERGFLMKGRIAALYANLKALGYSPFLTDKEKDELAIARVIISDVQKKFDINTTVLKMKTFGAK